MIFLLAYVSSAIELFSDEQLSALLVQSRDHNQTANITGMLLYKEGSFMQLLEGPQEEVLSLMSRIEIDTRHRNVMIILQEVRAEREFDHWAMAFKRIDYQTSIDLPGYSDFLDFPLDSEYFRDDPSRALKLLHGFKKIAR